MTKTVKIVSTNTELDSTLQHLQAGDIINCRLRIRPEEEHLLLDLVERGVHLFPSATSQLASRSKVFQTRLFQDSMIKDTMAIYDIHGVLDAIAIFNRHYPDKKVILKRDKKNGGLGVHLYNSIEEIFNSASQDVIPFPFVIQPYIEDYVDLRVIVIENYMEAYQRINPDNFRQNLHCGGNNSPYPMNKKLKDFCELIMARGKFPYAHIDLMIDKNDAITLTEINLRGGIRGATITPDEYTQRIKMSHARAIEKIK